MSVFLSSFLQSTTTRRASGPIFEKTDFDNTGTNPRLSTYLHLYSSHQRARIVVAEPYREYSISISKEKSRRQQENEQSGEIAGKIRVESSDEGCRRIRKKSE